MDLPRLPEAFEAEFSAPGMSPVSVYTAEQMEDYARAALAARQLGGITEELDRALGQAIDQRERYQEVADDLASHIERITGVEIGEHSSVNCPWQNAIDAAEEYTPAQGIDLGQLPRAMELMQGVSRTLVEWAYDDQREAINIVKALIDHRDAAPGVDRG